jgi:hypothetical protein
MEIHQFVVLRITNFLYKERNKHNNNSSFISFSQSHTSITLYTPNHLMA